LTQEEWTAKTMQSITRHRVGGGW